MMTPLGTPMIPESAPFTPEQRAYLNGFFAGLFSRAPVPADRGTASTQPAAPGPLQPLTILFGSQTGNAEGLSRRIAKEAGQRGFAPAVVEMGQYPHRHLPSEQSLLIVTSTYGDGEPPDNARLFWQFVSSDQAPSLPGLNFSVLALGDSNYPRFCECGRNFHRRLEALGARCVYPRVDCDVDFEEPFLRWLEGVLPALASTKLPGLGSKSPQALSATLNVLTDRSSGQPEEHTGAKTCFSRSTPFPARLLTNRKLNGPGSGKETRHLEILLDGSGLSYEVGDALGVMPVNCPELVEDILRALDSTGEENVLDANGGDVTLREALLRHYEVTRITPLFLQAVAERSGNDTLKHLSGPAANGELRQFLWGREIIDLLLEFPEARFAPKELVGLLKNLRPRLYSIASSPKVKSNQAHLTVNVVRYESRGRARKGVCSCFLAERVTEGTPAPVFVQANSNFRPPRDSSRPIIMVGPGTGVAPFRAFLQERRATGATGRNWLFFGDRHAATDFLYREELETMLGEGVLTRLDTAFSRDQEQKVYVQHRLREEAREIFDWLEQGAHFYVCGDAQRMAADVDAALHQAIQRGGGRTPEDAEEYVRRLKAEKRYQRDVY